MSSNRRSSKQVRSHYQIYINIPSEEFRSLFYNKLCRYIHLIL